MNDSRIFGCDTPQSFKHRAGLLAVTGSCVAAFASQNALSQEETDAWRFTVGVGAMSEPEYPGSDESEIDPLPVLSAERGRYFFGSVPGAGVPAGLGAYLIRNEHWRVGVGLGTDFEDPREESDSPRLRGLGDVEASAMGAAFASYTHKWLVVRFAAVTDIGDKEQGTRASVDLEGKYSPFDKLVLTAGPGLTWADSEYNQTLFGIDALQSARSGQAAYAAEGGVNSWRFTVGANYRLTENWGLGARFVAASLEGDAADSPITENETQNMLAVFATYAF